MTDAMDNIDTYLNDVSKAIDKGIELEHDINLFAAQLSENLFPELDREGVLANFYDTNFSFKFTTYTGSITTLKYDVRMLDLDDWKKCSRLSVPEYAKPIKRASFEHDPQFSLKDELRSAIVMLMFDYYDIPIGPQDLGEDENVSFTM